ncbi:MAG: TolC family protein [bacterium]
MTFQEGGPKRARRERSLRDTAALGALWFVLIAPATAEADQPADNTPVAPAPSAPADVPLIDADPPTAPPVTTETPAAPEAPPAPDAPLAPEPDPLTAPVPQQGAPLTLAEAIEIALARSYAIRTARADLEIAEARIDEAYGSVYPRVDLSAQYTRTFYSPNPFQGSDAGDFFSSLGAIPWLVFNESTRQQGGQPLSFEDYFIACGAGDVPAEVCPADAGVSGDDNPFLIPNQAGATITVTQILYNGKAFAGIDAAEGYREQQLDAIHHEATTAVAEVGRAYYRARLAQRQAAVTRASVERVQETLTEITRRVERGVLPQFQQLSTEVELANLQSALLRAEAGAADATDALKLTIGLPVTEPIALRTELTLPDRVPVGADVDAAIQRAETQRADLARLRKTRELLHKQRKLAAADYYPIVQAVGSFGLVGNIPDDPAGGPFDDTYWSPSVTAGIQLQWNLFGGFATQAAVAQQDAEIRKAETQYEQAIQGVRLEVTRALRQVDSARRQLDAQTRNVERAELNYRHAEIRVREGVSSALERREASQQLDESRLNRLQAVHDLLLAWIDYEIAIGTPPAEMQAVRAGRGPATEEAP